MRSLCAAPLGGVALTSVHGARVVCADICRHGSHHRLGCGRRACPAHLVPDLLDAHYPLHLSNRRPLGVEPGRLAIDRQSKRGPRWRRRLRRCRRRPPHRRSQRPCGRIRHRPSPGSLRACKQAGGSRSPGGQLVSYVRLASVRAAAAEAAADARPFERPAGARHLHSVDGMVRAHPASNTPRAHSPSPPHHAHTHTHALACSGTGSMRAQLWRSPARRRRPRRASSPRRPSRPPSVE